MSDDREVIFGFEIVPTKGLKPGTLLLVPNKEDFSVNDIFIITGVDDKGDGIVEPFKPIPKELSNDEYWLGLIMALVNYARQNKKEEYRNTRKEIKRLMLEDKEARAFFQTAFNSVKL